MFQPLWKEENPLTLKKKKLIMILKNKSKNLKGSKARNKLHVCAGISYNSSPSSTHFSGPTCAGLWVILGSQETTMWTYPILILIFGRFCSHLVYLPKTSHGLVYLLLASLLALRCYCGYLFILYAYITIFCGQFYDRPFFGIIA